VILYYHTSHKLKGNFLKRETEKAKIILPNVLSVCKYLLSLYSAVGIKMDTQRLRDVLNYGVFLEGVQQHYCQNIITAKWRNCEKSSDFSNHTFYNLCTYITASEVRVEIKKIVVWKNSYKRK